MATATDKEKAPGLTTCAVEVFPSPVDAGADLTLIGTVSSSPPTDMVGKILTIKDQDGNEVGTVDLTEYNGETNVTGPLMVKAPAKVGAYTWTVVCPAHETDSTSYKEASAPFPVNVQPHLTTVTVWDVPFSVPVRDRLRIKVGIKCSNDCRLGGLGFAIHNHEGAEIATATLGSESAPGTGAVYFAEVELQAPDQPGLVEWSAKVPATEFIPNGSEVALSHRAGASTFLVKAVSAPDHRVTVEAIDGDKQAPIRNAQVVMDPYRAVTDQRGIAELRVAKGEYKLYVFGPRYYRFERKLEVTGDMNTKAVLYEEPAPDRN